MLHIIDSFPVDHSELELTNSGDTVLFLKNAVFAVKKCDSNLSMLRQVLSHLNMCVRKTDLITRGLSPSELAHNVTIIDEQEYRAITEQDGAIRSWN